MPKPELIPLTTITATLGKRHTVGDGPMGTRVIVTVDAFELAGDRLTGTMASPTAADWLTVAPDGSYGTLDVRLTAETNDGAVVYIEYSGRIDFASGSIVTAPLFQTGDERYSWLNKVQAIGIGDNSGADLVYEVYEVRPV